VSGYGENKKPGGNDAAFHRPTAISVMATSGVFRREGFLKIVDRKKDMIIVPVKRLSERSRSCRGACPGVGWNARATACLTRRKRARRVQAVCRQGARTRADKRGTVIALQQGGNDPRVHSPPTVVQSSMRYPSPTWAKSFAANCATRSVPKNSDLVSIKVLARRKTPLCFPARKTGPNYSCKRGD